MGQNNKHISIASFLKRNKEAINVAVFFVAVLLVSIYILNMLENKHQRDILGGVYQYSSYQTDSPSDNFPASSHTSYRPQRRNNYADNNINMPDINTGSNHFNVGGSNNSNNRPINNTFGGSIISKQNTHVRTRTGGTGGAFAGAGLAIAQSSNNSANNESSFNTSLPSTSGTSINNINSSSTPSDKLTAPYQQGQGGTDPGGNPNKKNKLPIKNGNVFLVIAAILYGGYKYYSFRKKGKSNPVA